MEDASHPQKAKGRKWKAEGTRMEKRETRKDRKREWEGTAMTLKKLSCILDLQEFKKRSFSLPLDYEICKDEERQMFFFY